MHREPARRDHERHEQEAAEVIVGVAAERRVHDEEPRAHRVEHAADPERARPRDGRGVEPGERRHGQRLTGVPALVPDEGDTRGARHRDPERGPSEEDAERGLEDAAITARRQILGDALAATTGGGTRADREQPGRDRRAPRQRGADEHGDADARERAGGQLAEIEQAPQRVADEDGLGGAQDERGQDEVAAERNDGSRVAVGG